MGGGGGSAKHFILFRRDYPPEIRYMYGAQHYRR